MQITLKNREDLVNQYSYKEYSKLDYAERYEMMMEINLQKYDGVDVGEALESISNEDTSVPLEERARQTVMEVLVKEFDDYSDNEFLEFLSNHDKELLEKAVISDVKRNKVLGLF